MVHTYAQPFPSFGLLTALDLPVQRALCAHQQGMQCLSAEWRREVQIGSGLQNLGNSCYLNSVLQCLAHLPPLANICLAKQHSRSCKLSKDNRPCICCTFERQVVSMLTAGQYSNGYRGAVAPSAIYNSVHVLNKNLQRGRQEDSHELLRSLVDALERNLLRQAGNYNPQRPPRHPRTLVNQLFGGILQSQVRCLSCGHCSNTWDPCMDISLEIGANCSSVEDALTRFTTVEKLDGDNKYRCEGCKQLVPAHKQMTVYDDPNVLVIHLKRFDGIFGAKISREVAFSETLDLEPYVCSSRRIRSNGSSSGNNGLLNGYNSNGSSSSSTHSNGSCSSSSLNNRCQCSSSGSSGCRCTQHQQQVVRESAGHYQLHGVLVHHGYSANSGHYLAYVKDGVPPSGHWHCMNDAQVYRVNVPTVLKQQAYMLFYVRTSMKPQAHLPEQPAAAAVTSPGRLKRSSLDDGQQQQQQQQQHRLIGPQLPPHLLVKRQKVEQSDTPRATSQQQHQQQQPMDAVDMFAEGSEQQQQQQQQSGPVFGPQLPPWYNSRRRSSEQQDAAAAAEPATAATTAPTPAAAATPGDAVGGSSSGGAASAAGAAEAGNGQFFAWARSQLANGNASVDHAQQQQQPQEQQQQQVSSSGAQQHQQQQQPAIRETPDPAMSAEIRALAQEAVKGVESEAKALLKAQLEAAKQRGCTYEQCKAKYQKDFRTHDLFKGVAVSCMKSLLAKFANGGTGQ